MLLIKTAFKNIIGSGKRTWLNVTVLSLTLVIMVAYAGTNDGFVEEARRETREWEIREGQLWHPEYDRFDIFTLQDAHGVIPDELAPCVQSGASVPILVLQGSMFPKGRLQNVLLKGIPVSQTALALPSWEIVPDGSGDIPAIIGKRMAKSADMTTGDRVMLRWRDHNGVFDARQIVIVHIFDSKVPAVDGGQIWFNLDDLYEMSGMAGQATYFVQTRDCLVMSDVAGWHFKDLKFLMKDIDIMEQTARMEGVIIFVILLSIALLAVYDTQVLSIFRRQKEIGTYVALGMTPRTVTWLFTLEGTTYSILAALVSFVWGAPLLALYASYGIPIPGSDDYGIAMGDVLVPVFKVSSILITFGVVALFSALVSYLPARKIARQNMVLALKGKIH
ncbi:MAG: FtsX-like permease family protein [Bacteroidales bacterium]|nr:FtsX-like permease family protein [Bacteroidales bacterium]